MIKTITDILKEYPLICLEGTNCVGKNYLFENKLNRKELSIYKTFRSMWPNMESPKGRKARRMADLDMTQAPNLVVDFIFQQAKENNFPKKKIIMDRGFISSWSYIMFKEAFLAKPRKLTPHFDERLIIFDKQIYEIGGAHILLVASEKVLRKHWKIRLDSKEFTPSLLQTLSIQNFMLELIERYNLKSFRIIEVTDSGEYEEITLKEARKLIKFKIKPKKLMKDELKVYIAGPFFNNIQKNIIKSIEDLVSKERLNSFSPSRDSKIISKDSSKEELSDVFKLNVDEIKNSDFVIALIDYPGTELYTKGKNNNEIKIDLPDSGTVWEMGAAYILEKPVIGVFSENPQKINLMLAEGTIALTCGIESLSRVIEEVKAYLIDKRAGIDTTERIKHIRSLYKIKSDME